MESRGGFTEHELVVRRARGVEARPPPARTPTGATDAAGETAHAWYLCDWKQSKAASTRDCLLRVDGARIALIDPKGKVVRAIALRDVEHLVLQAAPACAGANVLIKERGRHANCILWMYWRADDPRNGSTSVADVLVALSHLMNLAHQQFNIGLPQGAVPAQPVTAPPTWLRVLIARDGGAAPPGRLFGLPVITEASRDPVASNYFLRVGPGQRGVREDVGTAPGAGGAREWAHAPTPVAAGGDGVVGFGSNDSAEMNPAAIQPQPLPQRQRHLVNPPREFVEPQARGPPSTAVGGGVDGDAPAGDTLRALLAGPTQHQCPQHDASFDSSSRGYRAAPRAMSPSGRAGSEAADDDRSAADRWFSDVASDADVVISPARGCAGGRMGAVGAALRTDIHAISPMSDACVGYGQGDTGHAWGARGEHAGFVWDGDDAVRHGRGGVIAERGEGRGGGWGGRGCGASADANAASGPAAMADGGVVVGGSRYAARKGADDVSGDVHLDAVVESGRRLMAASVRLDAGVGLVAQRAATDVDDHGVHGLTGERWGRVSSASYQVDPFLAAPAPTLVEGGSEMTPARTREGSRSQARGQTRARTPRDLEDPQGGIDGGRGGHDADELTQQPEQAAPSAAAAWREAGGTPREALPLAYDAAGGRGGDRCGGAPPPSVGRDSSTASTSVPAFKMYDLHAPPGRPLGLNYTAYASQVFVTGVDAGSPAAAAGVAMGALLYLDHHPIYTEGDLTAANAARVAAGRASCALVVDPSQQAVDGVPCGSAAESVAASTPRAFHAAGGGGGMAAAAENTATTTAHRRPLRTATRPDLTSPLFKSLQVITASHLPSRGARAGHVETKREGAAKILRTASGRDLPGCVEEAEGQSAVLLPRAREEFAHVPDRAASHCSSVELREPMSRAEPLPEPFASIVRGVPPESVRSLLTRSGANNDNEKEKGNTAERDAHTMHSKRSAPSSKAASSRGTPVSSAAPWTTSGTAVANASMHSDMLNLDASAASLSAIAPSAAASVSVVEVNAAVPPPPTTVSHASAAPSPLASIPPTECIVDPALTITDSQPSMQEASRTLDTSTAAASIAAAALPTPPSPPALVARSETLIMQAPLVQKVVEKPPAPEPPVAAAGGDDADGRRPVSLAAGLAGMRRAGSRSGGSSASAVSASAIGGGVDHGRIDDLPLQMRSASASTTQTVGVATQTYTPARLGDSATRMLGTPDATPPASGGGAEATSAGATSSSADADAASAHACTSRRRVKTPPPFCPPRMQPESRARTRHTSASAASDDIMAAAVVVTGHAGSDAAAAGRTDCPRMGLLSRMRGRNAPPVLQTFTGPTTAGDVDHGAQRSGTISNTQPPGATIAVPLRSDAPVAFATGASSHAVHGRTLSPRVAAAAAHGGAGATAARTVGVDGANTVEAEGMPAAPASTPAVGTGLVCAEGSAGGTHHAAHGACTASPREGLDQGGAAPPASAGAAERDEWFTGQGRAEVVEVRTEQRQQAAARGTAWWAACDPVTPDPTPVVEAVVAAAEPARESTTTTTTTTAAAPPDRSEINATDLSALSAICPVAQDAAADVSVLSTAQRLMAADGVDVSEPLRDEPAGPAPAPAPAPRRSASPLSAVAQRCASRDPAADRVAAVHNLIISSPRVGLAPMVAGGSGTSASSPPLLQQQQQQQQTPPRRPSTSPQPTCLPAAGDSPAHRRRRTPTASPPYRDGSGSGRVGGSPARHHHHRHRHQGHQEPGQSPARRGSGGSGRGAVDVIPQAQETEHAPPASRDVAEQPPTTWGAARRASTSPREEARPKRASTDAPPRPSGREASSSDERLRRFHAQRDARLAREARSAGAATQTEMRRAQSATQTSTPRRDRPTIHLREEGQQTEAAETPPRPEAAVPPAPPTTLPPPHSSTAPDMSRFLLQQVHIAKTLLSPAATPGPARLAASASPYDADYPLLRSAAAASPPAPHAAPVLPPRGEVDPAPAAAPSAPQAPFDFDALMTRGLEATLGIYPRFRDNFMDCTPARQSEIMRAWVFRDRDDWLRQKLLRCHAVGSFDAPQQPQGTSSAAAPPTDTTIASPVEPLVQHAQPPPRERSAGGDASAASLTSPHDARERDLRGPAQQRRGVGAAECQVARDAAQAQAWGMQQQPQSAPGAPAHGVDALFAPEVPQSQPRVQPQPQPQPQTQEGGAQVRQEAPPPSQQQPHPPQSWASRMAAIAATAPAQQQQQQAPPAAPVAPTGSIWPTPRGTQRVYHEQAAAPPARSGVTGGSSVAALQARHPNAPQQPRARKVSFL